MNENETRDFTAIPADACTLVSGAFELGDNGENSKTAPIRMVARSGQPIEHWFWGRVVHDLAGMHMHKSRLPIDYVHDAKEVIGYLNRFDTESGDLVASGALVPFGDSDRATEVVYKAKQGVPYEASINFGGDGIRIQEIGDGQVTDVNGFVFEGPGVVIREWPLRGVAVCPYGADMNTESKAFADNTTTYSADVVVELNQETEEMSTEETTEAVDTEQTEEVQTEELSTESVEAVETVEAEETGEAEADETTEETETESEAVEETEEPDQTLSLDADEFCRIADEFGAEIAAQTVRDGGNYESALRLAYDRLNDENEQLKAKLSESAKGGTPAKVVEAKERKPLIRIK